MWCGLGVGWLKKYCETLASKRRVPEDGTSCGGLECKVLFEGPY